MTLLILGSVALGVAIGYAAGGWWALYLGVFAMLLGSLYLLALTVPFTTAIALGVTARRGTRRRGRTPTPNRDGARRGPGVAAG